MASEREIQRLFQEFNLEEHIDDMDLEVIEESEEQISWRSKKGESFENYCIRKAKEIDIKKFILICAWKINQPITNVLLNPSKVGRREESEETKKKIIELARKYIKPQENIVLFKADVDLSDHKNEKPIITTFSSQEVLYGKEREKIDTTKLDSIKETILNSYQDFILDDLKLIYSINYSFTRAFALAFDWQ